MRQRIPSLSSLRAFEAAASHLNLRRAAKDLFITESAVSRQIIALEKFLGVELFRRANQRVTLQAKAGKFNHVYIGGAGAPSPSDGVILSAGMSVTGTSDHFWVRGTDAIAVLVED